jgi:hypothetical protein
MSSSRLASKVFLLAKKMKLKVITIPDARGLIGVGIGLGRQGP